MVSARFQPFSFYPLSIAFQLKPFGLQQEFLSSCNPKSLFEWLRRCGNLLSFLSRKRWRILTQSRERSPEWDSRLERNSRPVFGLRFPISERPASSVRTVPPPRYSRTVFGAEKRRMTKKRFKRRRLPVFCALLILRIKLGRTAGKPLVSLY